MKYHPHYTVLRRPNSWAERISFDSISNLDPQTCAYYQKRTSLGALAVRNELPFTAYTSYLWCCLPSESRPTKKLLSTSQQHLRVPLRVL